MRPFIKAVIRFLAQTRGSGGSVRTGQVPTPHECAAWRKTLSEQSAQDDTCCLLVKLNGQADFPGERVLELSRKVDRRLPRREKGRAFQAVGLIKLYNLLTAGL